MPALACCVLALGCDSYPGNRVLASDVESDDGAGRDVISVASGADLACDDQGIRMEMEVCNTGTEFLDDVVIEQKLPAGLAMVEGSLVVLDPAGNPIDAWLCDDDDDDDDADDDDDDDDEDEDDHDDGDDDEDGDDHDDDGDDDEDGDDHDDDGDDDEDGDDSDDDGDDDEDGDDHGDDDDERGEPDEVEICLGSSIPPGECVTVTFVAAFSGTWSTVEVHGKMGDPEDQEDVEATFQSGLEDVLSDMLTAVCTPCDTSTTSVPDLATLCGLPADECDGIAVLECVDSIDTAIADFLDEKCTACCPNDPLCGCILGE